jgi:hypothetical protein
MFEIKVKRHMKGRKLDLHELHKLHRILFEFGVRITSLRSYNDNINIISIEFGFGLVILVQDIALL